MARVKNKINWHASTMKDRMKIIEEIKSSISKNDGYIINFNMFSDLVLSLSIEIEEDKISGLYQGLSKIISISEQEPDNLNPNSRSDWWVLMNISFGRGKGNLRTEIPNVPG